VSMWTIGRAGPDHHERLRRSSREDIPIILADRVDHPGRTCRRARGIIPIIATDCVDHQAWGSRSSRLMVSIVRLGHVDHRAGWSRSSRPIVWKHHGGSLGHRGRWSRSSPPSILSIAPERQGIHAFDLRRARDASRGGACGRRSGVVPASAQDIFRFCRDAR
jgi:hypothetical protein